MKRLVGLINIRNVTIVIISSLIVFGCGSGGANGELVGSTSGKTIEQPTPFGMTYIPQGSFIRGTGGGDPSYQLITAKRVSISAFYMDETEITNNEYRQFVNYVKDSVTRKILGETFPEFVIESTTDDGEPSINWNTKIKMTPEVEEALMDLYIPAEDRFEHAKEIDIKKLNYEYYTFDYNAAARKSFEEQEDDIETDVYYSAFVNRPHAMQSRQQFVSKHMINVYPDTLCWIFDWSYSYNEPMTASYYSSPMYANYPVVGINWKQARAFCAWRTRLYNAYMSSLGYPSAQSIRLPTEAEWEYAARGGLELNPYPWGGPYARNLNGCVLGNFKPGRGNYTLDGSLYPCIVGAYSPNDYGLYDMMGNVAEWCIDAYDESIGGVSDMNPSFTYDAKDDDGEGRKRKVIKGGSFKDFTDLTKVYYRDYEYQDTCKSYIGFRCVQSYLGRGKSADGSSGSNVY